jgi:tRNA pseudouridine55 synthase
MRRAGGDFVLPVNKPVGPTSHDVVAMARRALGTRRIGHSGTLDPFASGLLLLCVGQATRIAEFLSGLDKCYRAVARLGVETDTHDLDGQVTEAAGGVEAVTADHVRSTLASFRGATAQVPPQFSAKKVDGESMHRRARRGERVELEPVAVTVYSMELLDFAPPDVGFSICCSSGTYVRAIARDLGRRLGTGAHLTLLHRTAVGLFSSEDALPLAAMGDPDAWSAAAIEPAAALAHLATFEVDETAALRLRQGQRIRVLEAPVGLRGADPADCGGRESLLAVTCNGDLVSVAQLDDGVLRPRKVFSA